MRVLFERGSGSRIYIIEENDIYYLVNIGHKTLSKAEPENMPDMFLKFGYFEDVEDVSDEECNKINEIFMSEKDKFIKQKSHI